MVLESDCGPLIEDHRFSLKILGSKVVLVLLCKFSLYRAVRASIGARARRLQSHQPHGWSGPGSGMSTCDTAGPAVSLRWQEVHNVTYQMTPHLQSCKTHLLTTLTSGSAVRNIETRIHLYMLMQMSIWRRHVVAVLIGYDFKKHDQLWKRRRAEIITHRELYVCMKDRWITRFIMFYSHFAGFCMICIGV